MALTEIKVPDIGDFDSVGVIEVLVNVGDTIKVEQSLITAESDKASMEIPSSHAGVLKELKPGQYTLVVEAAREAGGYEAVRVPFTWGKPGKAASAKGSSELGLVTVAVQ